MTHQPVHLWFSQTAAADPARVAIELHDRSVSFGCLERRSNMLANSLRARGVQPGSPVAIMCEDPERVITSMLAVLKAGCAFVNLDPRLPEARLAEMLRLVQPACWITDDEPEEQGDERLPEVQWNGDDFCSVYFTSGSTGTPKAIAGRLKGIDHFIRWQLKALSLEPGVRVSQLLPLFFDGSLRDIFVPLCVGGTICIPESREVVMDAARLLAWLDERRINLVHCVPSLLRALLNEGLDSEQLQGLRHVVMAGEALLVADVQRWMAIYGERIKLVNLYGTSETTMAKFSYEVSAADLGKRTIPIGKPIEGAAAVIVDERGRPCPPGMIGEIYIRTPYRALGYYGEPERTAEVFIRNLFSDDPTDIVYKTGDLARMLEDENYEFLGRRDQQVKIRGLRVELSEIESRLRSHPAVAEVCVVDREGSDGLKYLCAYIVTTTPVEIEELRTHLSEQLPDYMVPSAWMRLEELPRTLTGKVDRRALPEVEVGRARGEYVAPRNAVEELVAGIWCEVLGVGEVGVEDNFFEVGGHSLRATQVLTRVRRVLGVEVSLGELFEGPTVAEIARRVEEELSRGGERKVPSIRKRAGNESVLPVSFAQQRLWFLDRLEPASYAYNIPAALKLMGDLDLPALQNTLDEIVRRHESLRTTFAEREGEPVQVISAPAPVPLPLIDVKDISEAARLASEEARRPFDLEQGPLLRVRLLRLSEREHVVLFTMHHIISDGWSMGVLVREVAALYAAYSRGEGAALPPLEVQYGDYAVWQREWLRGAVLEEQLQYWREQLGGELPVLELPTDRRRPARQSYRGATETVTLDEELTRKVKELSRREGVTLFMLLLGAFEVLLHRYTAHNDIIVGSPVAGRVQSEVESLVGFFINTIVLRVDLSGEPSFRDLLQRIREVSLGAYAHQEVPFEMLVDELQPERDMSRTPLFQVTFSLQNAPREDLSLPGLDVSMLPVPTHTSKFDLSLIVLDTAQGLTATFEYNTDLFYGATIGRLAHHFVNLLSAVVNDPSMPVSIVPLLDPHERHELLTEWNQTEVAYDRQRCIHQLFEEHAERTPEAVAIVDDHRQLTYRELNERANQLARRLQREGVGPESRVGVMTERGVEMIVAVLGVLKAGGAYVPLDQNYPAERLQYMVEDSGARVVVTSGERCEWLNVREVNVNAEGEETGNVESEVSGENLAYVIYTSGSTGKPKGVETEHGSMINLVQWQQWAHGITPADRQSQLASLSFDASVWEIFPYLTAGASVYILSEETRASWPKLSAWLVQNAITLCFLPTPLAEIVLKEQWPADLSLRMLFTGGDHLHYRPEKDLPFRLINKYGPTEYTAITTWGPIHTGTEMDALPSIGRPVNNTQIYLLDSHLQPVPVGVPGELHIGGAGLARGYHERPELTAEKFIPNPFSETPGARLYRTGDLARYLPNGEIDFIGRRDNQVKIRGFRIELGEIEAVLGQHEAARECVVLVQQHETGGKRLMAYLTVKKTKAVPSSDELRAFLRRSLAEYMLPSVFVVVDEMPRTPNGKIDRRALPAPDAESRESVAPQNPIQEVLADVWSKLLEVEHVGAHDNFFSLGGHSLLATQLISRVRDVFGVELPLSALFEGPTLERVAAQIEAQLRGGVGRAVPPVVKRAGSENVLPVSFAQQRLWFFDRLEPASYAYNVPAALRVVGALDVPALQNTLDEIVRRHESLRTTFAEHEGQPVQVIGAPAPVPLPVMDLTHLSEEEREDEAARLASVEARRPFDLEQGPLLRVRLLRLGEREHVVLFTMHHIISDGWSMGVLVHEVAALYEAFSRGEEAELPLLELQYGDYAVWQREWLSGAVLEEQLAYWRAQLGGELPVLELPADRKRPGRQSYRGATEIVALDEELTRKIRSLSRREGVTLFMVLLGAFEVLLHRYTGQSDVVVGTNVANRNQGETENLIGLFINNLVLRADLSGEPSFRELLRRVREVCLGAYAHQDVPFERVVEELRPERTLSHMPLFQVMFVLQNAPKSTLESSELTLEPLQFERTVARFDLLLNLGETEQEIRGTMEYSTDLFDRETIEQMVEHYKNLLTDIVEHPDKEISLLSLSSAEESSQLSDKFRQETHSIVFEDQYAEGVR